MQRKDILILEDEIPLTDLYSIYCQNNNLDFITFSSGIQALNYLNSLNSNHLPNYYLIDMQIKSNRNTEDELASSEKIFHLLKLKGVDTNSRFRFITGHYSEYDSQVIERTNAKYLLKCYSLERTFIEDIASKKQTPLEIQRQVL